MREETSFINYSFNHVPTIRAFVRSDKRIKCIMGPIGSGKSSGCVLHLLNSAIRQAPNQNNVRETFYAIIRNSVKELKDTTRRTIDHWLHPLNPTWKESELIYKIEFGLDDGTIVRTEWALRALDRPDQVKDLLSLELSGAWINEAREIPREIFTYLNGRIGRFPHRLGDFCCSYPYVIMDTNPPDTDSWIYKLFEEGDIKEEFKDDITIFKQPSGLSPEAENLPNLPPNYYRNSMIGADSDWIKVHIHGEYGVLRQGKPVFPNFVYSIHVSKEPLTPIKSIPLTIGMDFGLFPACVIAQELPDGRMFAYDEVTSLDVTDLETFIVEKLRPLLNSKKYARIPVTIIGDPAGGSRSQIDSRTCFNVLRSYNYKAYPAYTNSFSTRTQAVNMYLTRMIKGKPALQIDPSCKLLIKGMVSNYCLRKLQVSYDSYSEYPEKNIYSHVADALQYVCLGTHPKSIENVSEFAVDIQDSFGYKPEHTKVTIRTGGWF